LIPKGKKTGHPPHTKEKKKVRKDIDCEGGKRPRGNGKRETPCEKGKMFCAVVKKKEKERLLKGGEKKGPTGEGGGYQKKK